MAIELRKMGFSDFTIIEKASEFGGTWRDHIYPGCASDVPMHLFSLSTELNPGWTHTHAFQPEIQSYRLRLAHKYERYSKVMFNSTVVSATWDSGLHSYEVVVEVVARKDKEKEIRMTAGIVVSAVGLLEVPRFPNIPGRETSFRGTSFHSARWDASVDLAGKKVAVVGSGPSATQFVPIISGDPTTHVTQYRRSPSWILPPTRQKYSTTQLWLLKNIPFWPMALRTFYYLRVVNMQMVRTYMQQVTPPEYLDQVVPSHSDHKVGCKRVVFDTNYLSSLGRPNLGLCWDAIERFDEEGIVTKNGSTPFDVIIFATGYVTDRYPIHVKGNKGQTIAEYYEAQGGPTAYLGTTIPGFPNFFTFAGPNTATGHSSVLLTVEIQVRYILQLIRPLLSKQLLSFDVTPAATDAYNAQVQTRLGRFVWSKCASWYRTGDTGKIHTQFPGPMSLYGWWMRRVEWRDYDVVPAVGEWRSVGLGQRLLFLGLGWMRVGWRRGP
ncbi:hypothetical protein FB45DRAFT_843519 [Roridomyces roridus]|uniref:Uncharacterized protein n=1 Tax=Roridomyces roridus TaxID=1738132 RepID=A0AAD7B7B0_9AGAR|nr:hypothetical protein FB45DRAFT_843519 [Roridomyces roridus]